MATREGAEGKTAVGPLGLGRAVPGGGGVRTGHTLLCIRFAYADSEAPLIPSLWGGSVAPRSPTVSGLRPTASPTALPRWLSGAIEAWSLNLLNSPSSFICLLWEAQDCRHRCCL